MARETFVRYRTLCLLAVLAVLSIVCVGLLVAVVGRGRDSAAPAPASGERVAEGESGGAAAEEEAERKEARGTMAEKKEKQLTEPWEKDYRIPASTYAMHYDLYLHPDMETGLFTGQVDILIR